jgi:hypothetical protein
MFCAGIERFTAVLEAAAPAALRRAYLHMPGEDRISTKLKALYQGLRFVFAADRGR